jgi:hypothetical protein
MNDVISIKRVTNSFFKGIPVDLGKSVDVMQAAKTSNRITEKSLRIPRLNPLKCPG